MSEKLDTFTNKYVDAQFSISGQEEIYKLLQKDIFKVVSSDKIIMFEEVSSNI